MPIKAAVSLPFSAGNIEQKYEKLIGPDTKREHSAVTVTGKIDSARETN